MLSKKTLSKSSKFAQRTYFALSLTTALVAVQPIQVAADSGVSFGSAIVDATESNNYETVLHALQAGGNPNEIGDFGTSALMRAANNNNADIAKLLLKSGGNPNVADIGGATPLHIASRSGSLAVAKLLIDAGAKVSAVDNEGNTPLMLAASSENAEIAKLLVEAGADANAANNSGETALLYATQNSATDVVDVLVASGAKTDVVDEEGFSIAEVANRKNDQLLIAKLDSANPDHMIITMGGGFKSQSAKPQPQEQQFAAAAPVEKHYKNPFERFKPEYEAAREHGKQVLANLASQDVIDYAEYAQADYVNVPEIAPEDDEIAMLNTPAFEGDAVLDEKTFSIRPVEKPYDKIATAAGHSKKSWLAGVTEAFDAAGAFELASVKNYSEGTTYSLLELGKFKVKSFADQRVSELQNKYPEIFDELNLVIFERGASDNIEYIVNAGLLDSKDKASDYCKKLIAQGVRCSSVESAVITADQFKKFAGGDKPEYSAPTVEKAEIAAPATKTIKTLQAMAEETDVLPIPDLPPLPTFTPEEPKTLTKAVVAEAPKSVVAEAPKATAPLAQKLAAAPATTSAPTVTVNPEAAKSLVPAPKQVVAVTVKPEVATVLAAPAQKEVEEEIEISEEEEKSLQQLAGMSENEDAAEDSSTFLDSLIDSIYSEKEAAAAPIAKPEVAAAPAAKVKTIELPEQKKTVLRTKAAEVKPVSNPSLVSAKEVAQVRAETEAPKTLAKTLAAAPKPAPVVVKPEVAAAPAPKTAPTQPAPTKVATIATPVASAAQAPVVVKPEIATPQEQVAADKFVVARPVPVAEVPKIVEAAPVAAAPKARFEGDAFSRKTFNRKENRTWAKVEYFSTPDAASGFYQRYRQNGTLGDGIQFKASKDLLHGVYYAAVVGQFQSSADAIAFCNTVYTVEKLKCTVQAQVDYNYQPAYAQERAGLARHSNYRGSSDGIRRHSNR